jgi:pimeloyl-ACP methyl ester carboxylesterase
MMGGAWPRTGEGGLRSLQRRGKPELLFDVAAVLSTSVALGPVAEAFGVHEISSFGTLQSSSENLPASFDFIPASVDALTAALPSVLAGLPAVLPAALPVAPPPPFIGPEPVAEPHELVQGTRLLQQLSLLSVTGIADFATANPDAVTGLLAHPPAAQDVSSWWSALKLEQRAALRAGAPQLVGNLEGIPYTARDLANRSVLRSTMAELDATIVSQASGRTVIENARQQLKMLQSISDALGTGESQPRRTLMTLDVAGQGRAAIVLGDLRTADYVSYLVPGMFFTIENQMGDWVDAAARLYEEQLSWLQLFTDQTGTGAHDAPSQDAPSQDAPSQSETVATVAWIGYHTPNLTNVGGIDNAYEGRDALAGAIQGLQTIRADSQPYVTVIAHSYGSTAALMALTEFDFTVDALAMVGSPGSSAKSVDELHVRDGNVYVGEAAWDPIPNSSYFGSDPGAKSYGAKPMGVGGGLDFITHEVLLASTGHNEYFSAGTESMRNFALIGIGKGQFVTDGTGNAVAKLLASH